MDQATNILGYEKGGLAQRGYWEEYENGVLSFFVNQYVVPPRRTKLLFLAPLLIGAVALAFTRYRIILLLFLPFAFYMARFLLELGKWAVEDNFKIQPIIITASQETLSFHQTYGFDAFGVRIPLGVIEDLWVERLSDGPVRQAMDMSLWRVSVLTNDGRLMGMTIRCNQGADLCELEVKLRNAIGIGLTPTLGPGRAIPADVQRFEIVNKPGRVFMKKEGAKGWMFWK